MKITDGTSYLRSIAEEVTERAQRAAKTTERNAWAAASYEIAQCAATTTSRRRCRKVREAGALYCARDHKNYGG